MLTELQMTRFITCIFVMYICMGVHGEVEAHTHTHGVKIDSVMELASCWVRLLWC